MQAVILAAGRGTRLKELTSSRSKAMMPIAGKPMIARVIEMLIRGGLSEFIIVAHPEDEELRSLFEKAADVQLAFQSERKGAAHALSMAAPLIRANFLLTACDNLVEDVEVKEPAWESWIGMGKISNGLWKNPLRDRRLRILPVCHCIVSSTNFWIICPG